MSPTAGQTAPADPQRKTPRLPCRETVRLRKPYEVTGTAVDIGAGGIGLELPLPLEAGAAVELELFSGHAIALGTVRWAKPEGGGYRVGIQFHQEDWSIISRVQALLAGKP
jgi:hypothetical protein